MFASKYFEKTAGFTPRLAEPPDPATGMVVVIPCYQEPDILKTLDALLCCDPPRSRTEVIILVNEPEGSSPEISGYNEATMEALRQWKEEHSAAHITVLPAGPVRLPAKWAGVGLARKAGMDEALWRFHVTHQPQGIIISLDADTLVEPGYLKAIENHFAAHPADVGATICFRHQEEGFSKKQIEGIRRYERYMTYYKNAMAWSGYPHALYTVGSAFAVRAEAYMKRGGMTRRKAGEDFYFLQTLTQLGHVGEIETTTIHPSPRISLRVPFGTGQVMKKWMEGSGDLLSTFNLDAFRDLKEFFAASPGFFKVSPEEAERLVSQLPLPVAEFLRHEKIIPEILELSDHCSTPEVFRVRFFQVFTAFRILRFLNFSHPTYYQKPPLEECCAQLEALQRVKSAPIPDGRCV
jgi:hypothetical protein